MPRAARVAYKIRDIHAIRAYIFRNLCVVPKIRITGERNWLNVDGVILEG